MARPVTVIGGRAYDPGTGAPIGYRPGEKVAPTVVAEAPPTVGVGEEKWAVERRVEVPIEKVPAIKPSPGVALKITEMEAPIKKEVLSKAKITAITKGTLGTVRVKEPMKTLLIEAPKKEHLPRVAPTYPGYLREKAKALGVPYRERIPGEVEYQIAETLWYTPSPTFYKPLYGLEKTKAVRIAKVLTKESIVGYQMELREHPYREAAILGVSLAIQPAIAGARYAAIRYGAPLAIKAPKVIKAVKITAGVAGVTFRYVAPAVYGTVKTKEIMTAPTLVGKGRLIGRTGAEVTAFMVGAKLGGTLAAPIEYKTAIETELLVVPKGERALFRSKLSEVRRLAKITEAPKVRKIEFETEYIKPKAAKALEKYVLSHKEELLIGGSVAQRAQLAKGIKGRVPKDIDIYVKDVLRTQRGILQELKSAGVKRVATPKMGEITIRGKKAIEVKEMEKMIANIQSAQRYFFAPKQMGIARTPRGVPVMKLEIQAQRKVIAGYLERKLPTDIADVLAIKKSYLQQLSPKKRIPSLKVIPKAKITKPSYPEYPTYPGYKPYTVLATPYKPYKKYKGVKPYPIYKAKEIVKPYVPYKVPKKVVPYKPSAYKPTKKPPKAIAPYKVYPKAKPVKAVKPYAPYKKYKPIKPVPPAVVYKPEIKKPRKEKIRYEKEVFEAGRYTPSLVAREYGYTAKELEPYGKIAIGIRPLPKSKKKTTSIFGSDIGGL